MTEYCLCCVYINPLRTRRIFSSPLPKTKVFHRKMTCFGFNFDTCCYSAFVMDTFCWWYIINHRSCEHIQKHWYGFHWSLVIQFLLIFHIIVNQTSIKYIALHQNIPYLEVYSTVYAHSICMASSDNYISLHDTTKQWM